MDRLVFLIVTALFVSSTFLAFTPPQVFEQDSVEHENVPLKRVIKPDSIAVQQEREKAKAEKTKEKMESTIRQSNKSIRTIDQLDISLSNSSERLLMINEKLEKKAREDSILISTLQKQIREEQARKYPDQAGFDFYNGQFVSDSAGNVMVKLHKKILLSPLPVDTLKKKKTILQRIFKNK